MSAAPAKNMHHVEYVDGTGVVVTWEDGTSEDLDSVPRQSITRIGCYVRKADGGRTPLPAGTWPLGVTVDAMRSYVHNAVLNAEGRRIGRVGTPYAPIFAPAPKPTCVACGSGTNVGPSEINGDTLQLCGRCVVDYANRAPIDTSEVDPLPAPIHAAITTPVADTSAVEDLASALARLVPTSTIDPETVRAIVREETAHLVAPTRVVIERNGETREIPGTVHKVTPTVLRAIEAGVHVWLVGPAGTGKSTIGHKVSEALGLAFSAMSLSPTTPMSQIWGYMDAEGRYVETETYLRYRDGGVLMFDEMDNGHPSILASVNMLLSNGHCAFPCGMVNRHPDFRFIGTANTFGMGPDRQYVGRSQLDAATLDRFATIDVPVDEALETAVAMAQGADATLTTSLIAYVRALRANAETKKVLAIFSPRASIDGAKLLAAGFTMSEVIAMRVRKGISDQDWSKVADGIRVPA